MRRKDTAITRLTGYRDITIVSFDDPLDYGKS